MAHSSLIRAGVCRMLRCRCQAKYGTNCWWTRKVRIGRSLSFLDADHRRHGHSSAGHRARTRLSEHLIRTHGHRLANVNPLRPDGLMLRAEEILPALPTILRPLVKSVVQARVAAAPDDICDNGNGIILPDPVKGSDQEATIETLLRQYCCSGIGYEFMHCSTEEEREFFVDAIEQEQHSYSHHQPQQSNEAEGKDDETMDDMVWCWEQVARANAWEKLLEQRYPYCKRFSLEGLESGILALNVMLDTFVVENSRASSRSTGTDENDSKMQPRVVMGSLHRGRFNILHNVLQKSISSLLCKWDKTDGPTYDDISEGHSADVVTRSGRSLHLSLLAMPAHLESQDAAVNGKAHGHMVLRSLAQQQEGRQQSHKQPSSSSLQQLLMDSNIAQSVLPIIVHGDASFAGEGIVAETLQLSTFDGFACGGTVHVIFNNQIGYTTETQQLRSPHHRLVQVTDTALGIRAPILHVNADRIGDVLRASRLATRYRQIFGKDVVFDLVGYRRHGHNEADEPRITNVSMYKQIDAREPVVSNAQHVDASFGSEQWSKHCRQRMQEVAAEYASAAASDPHSHHGFAGDPGNSTILSSSSRSTLRKVDQDEWLDLSINESFGKGGTGVTIDELRGALTTISSIPDNFTLTNPTHKAVSRRAENLKMLLDDPDSKGSSVMIDWATAELLALSTLAEDGYFVRLCGQDSQRGTFSQRHAVWHDAMTGTLHYPLPPLVCIVNSPLSELGVLGFEHGVSLASPNVLVLWEAQFGDFANNGQVLIDTMISAEKDKFGLESNLVLLLPHGYDGMGPEHSSARLERFLSLHTDTPDMAMQIKEDNDFLECYQQPNFTVLFPSSPSNYFHALRRSFSWPFRRPMVVLTPKRTLRLPAAASPASEFLQSETSRASFSPVLDDPRNLSRSHVESLLLCSGEIFYDVLELVGGLPGDISQTVAILRVEELAPFPLKQLECLVKSYPGAKRGVWIQEEPQNMGALRFVAPFLAKLSPDVFIDTPISRPMSAAPAVGVPSKHKAEQSALLSEVRDWVRRVVLE